MPDIDTRVRGLAGGTKEMWLRLHYKEVSRFYIEHGPDACMEKYNMRKRTLEKFILGGKGEEREFTPGERALMVAETTNAGLSDIRHEVRQLREALAPVIPVCRVLLQVGSAMAQLAQLSQPDDIDFEESQEIDTVVKTSHVMSRRSVKKHI